MHIHQGELLKEKVAQSKLKVHEIAAQAKLPTSSLYDLYKRADVPRSKLQAICDVLQINIREFFLDLTENNNSLSSEDQAEYYTKAQVEMLRRECGFLKEQVKHLNTIIALLNEKLAALQQTKQG